VKDSGYDLLQTNATPVPYIPATKTASPPASSLSDFNYLFVKRAVVSELDLELPTLRQIVEDGGRNISSSTPQKIVASLKERILVLSHWESLKQYEAELKAEFADRFPTVLPPVNELPTDVYHRFQLVDANQVIKCRSYNCPKKYKEAWRQLLDLHLTDGRMRESTSPYVSPAFIIPKSDPSILPRWVNNYRILNSNTVPNHYPLPPVDTILSDCAKGKIWG
jgi:hypothetical protein